MGGGECDEANGWRTRLRKPPQWLLWPPVKCWGAGREMGPELHQEGPGGSSAHSVLHKLSAFHSAAEIHGA